MNHSVKEQAAIKSRKLIASMTSDFSRAESTPIPTDRGKRGTKCSLLVNQQGLPLGVVVSGVNTPDSKLLETTLLSIPIERPDPKEGEQHLSLDKGYSGEPCAATAKAQGYSLHMPDKANAKKMHAKIWTTQAAPLDCRSSSLMDQPLSPLTCPSGKEIFQLLVIALLRLRHDLLAQMRNLEVGSKNIYVPLPAHARFSTLLMTAPTT